MKICIVGGGHIGTTLACYVKYTHPNYEVNLFTRNPDKFSDTIKCNDIEDEKAYTIRLDHITNDASIAAKGAHIVFIALPHFAVEKAFKDIAPYVATQAKIGVLPGGGGCEFFFNKYFTNKQTLFGFQRVPFIARLQEYGKETNLKSWKPFSVVGTLQHSRIDDACETIELCGLKTHKAPNYLCVALTPTNPILHTSRTYELFGSHDRNYVFPQKQKFYVGWTDKASETMLTMDAELHQLLDNINEIDTTSIRPLSEHYESPTIKDMTAKINSIASFQSVYSPMKETEGGYVADLTSRMFTEDFPWGLMVIRSYFEYFGIDAPMMDEVLKWYSGFMGYQWYIEGVLKGKDLIHTGMIQNYNIKNKKELISLYCKE